MSATTGRPWPTPEAFFADEAEAFRPFEAILALDVAGLDGGPRAHGWSARDLLSHLVGWHAVATEVATELRASPRSPRKAAADAEWEARGDEINEEIRAAWAPLPLDEYRSRAREAREGLLAALRDVPLAHWWDDDEYFVYFLSELQGHYADHRAALDVVLGR
ncbi:MAG: ClbS/DfsB family four-helix bundle protein [Chloroflexi bacterium]|jgi:hypothetical protein|nr:ClbS/DfsB family four-helix bundle protein [Chloroflexota bacterium]